MKTAAAPSDRGCTRRRLLRSALAGSIAAAIASERLAAQEPMAGGGTQGTLRDPTVAGRSRGPTAPGDNDERIKRIEQQLRCTCGCNLDVFTCRTTDFTCTYSPELHREVVALHDDGKTAQQILDAFVAKYGERVLMAPKPVDFNLVGYLLPGAAILAGGAGLAWVIGRRAGGQAGWRTDEPIAAPPPSARPPVRPPAPEELDRLQRDLAEVDD